MYGEDYMETCEDIRHTEGMKELYSHRKETIERIFGTAKGKPRISIYAVVWQSADDNESRAYVCVHEFKKLAKCKQEWGLRMA